MLCIKEDCTTEEEATWKIEKGKTSENEKYFDEILLNIKLVETGQRSIKLRDFSFFILLKGKTNK